MTMNRVRRRLCTIQSVHVSALFVTVYVRTQAKTANIAIALAKPTCKVTERTAWAPLELPVGFARGSVDEEEAMYG